MEPAVAVKSFIVNDGKLLIIKRAADDVHKPNAWEIPGGRLKKGENPFEGLKRETLEETKLDIDILNPLRVHHFTRDDGQVITMIVFLCKALGKEVMVSDEHEAHEWIPIDEAKEKLVECFHGEVDLYRSLHLK